MIICSAPFYSFYSFTFSLHLYRQGPARKVSKSQSVYRGIGGWADVVHDRPCVGGRTH